MSPDSADPEWKKGSGAELLVLSLSRTTRVLLRFVAALGVGRLLSGMLYGVGASEVVSVISAALGASRLGWLPATCRRGEPAVSI